MFFGGTTGVCFCLSHCFLPSVKQNMRTAKGNVTQHVGLFRRAGIDRAEVVELLQDLRQRGVACVCCVSFFGCRRVPAPA